MKIISGGQTGVDTAALKAAVSLGLPYGGWVPRGRTNEEGKISDAFSLLRESESAETDVRTILNVQDSDALLVLTDGNKSGGTELAISEARRRNIPFLVVTLTDGNETGASDEIKDFLRIFKPKALNVAGPRESEAKGICLKAQRLLTGALSSL